MGIEAKVSGQGTYHGVRHNGFGTRHLHLEVHLLLRIQWVDGGAATTSESDALEHGEVVHVVRCVDGYGIILADTELLPQSMCKAVCAVVQVGVGE